MRTVDPSLFGDGLKTLSAAGVKVVSISIVKDAKPFGVTFNYLGADEIENDGKLLADWVIVHNGAKANAVFYGLPTFDFSNPLQQAFENEMKKNCPACAVRTVPIDAATIGTTAPRTVVADLQAHPATKVAVFVSLQIAQGLPAAMSAAGLSGITTVGRAATPGNLQDIKDGGLTASLAIDQPVSTWTAVDAAARLVEGGQPTASEKAIWMSSSWSRRTSPSTRPRGGPGTPTSRSDLRRCGTRAGERSDPRACNCRRLHATAAGNRHVEDVPGSEGIEGQVDAGQGPGRCASGRSRRGRRGA